MCLKRSNANVTIKNKKIGCYLIKALFKPRWRKVYNLFFIKKTDYIVCFKTLKIISIVGSIHDYD